MRISSSLIICILLLCLTHVSQAQAPVQYAVAFPNAVHHEAEISIIFSELFTGTFSVRIARSSPGRYALHEFAKNVYNVKAYNAAGQELTITRPNPHQWDIAGHNGT